MSPLWLAIGTQMAQLAPAISASLNPPVTNKAIGRLQGKLGLELPADFIAYLQTFNGQRYTNFSRGFYGLSALLPVAEIIDTNRNRRRLFGREPVAAGFRENKIRGRLWSPGWLAFASFQDTELLVLDLEPGINGT